jgi:hypothetical protein
MIMPSIVYVVMTATGMVPVVFEEKAEADHYVAWLGSSMAKVIEVVVGHNKLRDIESMIE